MLYFSVKSAQCTRLPIDLINFFVHEYKGLKKKMADPFGFLIERLHRRFTEKDNTGAQAYFDANAEICVHSQKEGTLEEKIGRIIVSNNQIQISNSYNR